MLRQGSGVPKVGAWKVDCQTKAIMVMKKASILPARRDIFSLSLSLERTSSTLMLAMMGRRHERESKGKWEEGGEEG